MFKSRCCCALYRLAVSEQLAVSEYCTFNICQVIAYDLLLMHYNFIMFTLFFVL